MEGKNKAHAPMADTVAAGAAYMVVLRLVVRFMGLISITFTARILTPQDFGIVGTASLVVGFFVILKQVGFGEAIIRLKTSDREIIDTIWTIQLLASVLIAAAIFFSADFAAEFLEEPRVADVLRWLSLVPLLDALNSPASAMFIRKFAFRHESILKIAQKFVLVVSVVVAALVLKSYWALVIAQIIAAALGIVLTQLAHPYLPRLTLKHFHSEYRFAIWTFVRNFSTYVSTMADEFIVRKITTSEVFGFYHVTRDLSRILIFETIGPVQTALLPAFSKLSDQEERFSRAIVNATGVLIIISFPIGLGCMLTAREIVMIALGSQWLAVIPFLSVVALGAAMNSVISVLKSVFTGINRQDISAKLAIVQAITTVLGCMAAGFYFGPLEVAIAFSGLAAFNLLLALIVLWRACRVRESLPFLFLRPALASVAMAAAVLALPIDETTFVAVAAIAKVATGALVYAGALLLLWYVSGRPQGGERTVINLLPSRFQGWFL